MPVAIYIGIYIVCTKYNYQQTEYTLFEQN